MLSRGIGEQIETLPTKDVQYSFPLVRPPDRDQTGKHDRVRPAKAAMTTFGQFIAKRRKQLNLAQNQIAAAIKQDDGKPISVQYLNDIEHGRRGAPPDYVLVQLAKLLRVPLDILYFRADRLPPDIRKGAISDQQAAAAYRALRRELRRPKKS